MKIFFLLLFFSFSFISCSKKQDEKQLILATNPWIGYTPLFYAKEKGYLKKLNIKLITAVSLAEASEFFNIAKADMLTTTQHEYNSLKQEHPTLRPIILLDRSNGGDMILSNRTVQELQKEKKVSVYLEINSINTELFKEFVKKYKIKTKEFKYINKDQAQIQDVSFSTDKAIIIVTYSPYDVFLIKKGFSTIASTKSIDSLLVIDAICTTEHIATKYAAELKKLKKVIDRSILEINNDTNASYNITKKYLSNISYDEYLASLKMIKWINKPNKKLLEKIKSLGYKEELLIQ